MKHESKRERQKESRRKRQVGKDKKRQCKKVNERKKERQKWKLTSYWIPLMRSQFSTLRQSAESDGVVGERAN